MALTLPHTPEKEKVFNGLRRTQDGMLYLTTIDPNKDSENVQYSNFFESGKSDSVPKDGSDYMDYSDWGVKGFTESDYIKAVEEKVNKKISKIFNKGGKNDS